MIYLRAARNLGVNQLTLFTRVILPAATPYIPGRRAHWHRHGVYWVIVSEMIAVNDGLGFAFWKRVSLCGRTNHRRHDHHRPLGLAIDTAVSRLNNHLLRWHRGLEH